MFDNMGDEFRGGVCGGTRWNIPATSTPFGFSPCLAVSTDQEAFDWVDMKGIFSKSIDDENDAHSHIPDSRLNHGHILDSSLQMFGMEAMDDWRQTFNVNGGGGSRTNHQSQIQLQDHTMLCSSLSDHLHDNPQDFNSSLQPFKSFSVDESNINNTTQHDLATAAFDTPNNISYGYSSKLLQTLFEDEDEDLVHESIFENRPLPMNYPCTNNSRVVSPPIPKQPFGPSVLISDQAPPLWNASSVASLNDIANNFFPSSSTRLMASSTVDNLSFPKITAPKVTSEASHGLSWSSPMKKNNSDRQPLKRSRMETPSPLPTFKVRKEKLGDRITALQQLVSPFGKTDTASVLHEAIDYIKFLHNQVNVLSSPYLRNGKPTMRHCKDGENTKNESSYVVVEEEEEGGNSKQDLKSRGLCLVPLSSTIPVAIETTRAGDFWTPNLGGGFR